MSDDMKDDKTDELCARAEKIAVHQLTKGGVGIILKIVSIISIVFTVIGFLIILIFIIL